MKEVKPVVDEVFGVFSGCPKVDQLNLFMQKMGMRDVIKQSKKSTCLARLGVPQEIGPVRVSLHDPELKEFSQTQVYNSTCDLQAPKSTNKSGLEYTTYIIAIPLREPVNDTSTNADPSHTLHHQHMVCTTLPNPWDFILRI